jgi:capsular exopolysaccharide synthesis family protein
LTTTEPALVTGLRLVRRHAWVIACAAAMTTAAAFAVSASQAPKYEASAQVVLRSAGGAPTTTGTPSAPERVAQTEADVARLRAVVARVLGNARVSAITSFLEDSSVEPRSDADVLDFRVRAREPARAARLATVYARAYVSYRRTLDRTDVDRELRDVNSRLNRLDASGQPDGAARTNLLERRAELTRISALTSLPSSLVNPAADATRVGPRTRLNVALGLVLGLLLGFGLALARDALDPRVRSGDEVATLLSASILGWVPAAPRRRRDGRSALLDAYSWESERFRIMRADIQLAAAELDPPARTFVVTSAIERETKTFVATNLAAAFATAGQRVVLINVDPRQPSLERALGIDERPGLTNVVEGSARLRDVARTIDVTGLGRGHAGSSRNSRGALALVPAGPPPANPAAFLRDPSFETVLAGVKASADVVIVHAPPMLAAEDARILCARLESLLVVIDASDARRPVLRSLARALSSCRPRLLGVVLAGIDDEAEVAAVDTGARRNGRSSTPHVDAESLWATNGVGRAATLASDGSYDDQPLGGRADRSRARRSVEKDVPRREVDRL